MSDFSLTLVLQFKTSKIINDMAKVQIKSEKVTPFGGIFKIQIIIEFINTSGGNLRNIRLIRTVAQPYSLPSMMLMMALTSAMSTLPSPVTSA